MVHVQGADFLRDVTASPPLWLQHSREGPERRLISRRATPRHATDSSNLRWRRADVRPPGDLCGLIRRYVLNARDLARLELQARATAECTREYRRVPESALECSKAAQRHSHGCRAVLCPLRHTVHSRASPPGAAHLQNDHAHAASAPAAAARGSHVARRDGLGAAQRSAGVAGCERLVRPSFAPLWLRCRPSYTSCSRVAPAYRTGAL